MAANLSERMDCGRNIAKVRSASKAASQSNVQMHNHVAKTLSPLVYRMSRATRITSSAGPLSSTICHQIEDLPRSSNPVISGQSTVVRGLVALDTLNNI